MFININEGCCLSSHAKNDLPTSLSKEVGHGCDYKIVLWLQPASSCLVSRCKYNKLLNTYAHYRSEDRKSRLETLHNMASPMSEHSQKRSRSTLNSPETSKTWVALRTAGNEAAVKRLQISLLIALWSDKDIMLPSG